jgi:hypothetical protein
MARRGGKAVTRRSRQRKGQRSATPARPKAAPETDVTAASGELVSSTPAAAVETPVAPKPPSRPSASPRASRAGGGTVVGSSRLGERAMQEYHYVRRDLRNIGVLLLIMAVMLVAAFVLFNVVGITKTA